jgi:hypothetical protein
MEFHFFLFREKKSTQKRLGRLLSFPYLRKMKFPGQRRKKKSHLRTERILPGQLMATKVHQIQPGPTVLT